jgi:hypothetical protein
LEKRRKEEKVMKAKGIWYVMFMVIFLSIGTTAVVLQHPKSVSAEPLACGESISCTDSPALEVKTTGSVGIFGKSDKGKGTGVKGVASNWQGKGVFGANWNSSSIGYGVYGQSSSPKGYGVYGVNKKGGYAGYFEGNSRVTGDLTVDGTLKIGFNSNVIIVAPSGGDYTSPVDAMNSITDASSTNPYLVKIMPGVYDIGTGSVQMKPYVDIEGSGELTTNITGTVSSGSAGVVNGADNAEIRFLTVENMGTGSYTIAIYNSNASPKITHVTATASGVSTSIGVRNFNSSPTMTNVTATALAEGGSNYGVNNESSSPTMTNVTATASGIISFNYGVNNESSSPTMTNVTATASGVFSIGVNNESSSPTMTNVTVTASGVSTSIGVRNSNSSPKMTNVTAAGKDGTNNYGIYNEATSGTYTIYADRSSFEGNTYSIYNDEEFILYIGASKLAGGSANASGSYYCVGVYDETYTALDASCQ